MNRQYAVLVCSPNHHPRFRHAPAVRARSHGPVPRARRRMAVRSGLGPRPGRHLRHRRAAAAGARRHPRTPRPPPHRAPRPPRLQRLARPHRRRHDRRLHQRARQLRQRRRRRLHARPRRNPPRPRRTARPPANSPRPVAQHPRSAPPADRPAAAGTRLPVAPEQDHPDRFGRPLPGLPGPAEDQPAMNPPGGFIKAPIRPARRLPHIRHQMNRRPECRRDAHPPVGRAFPTAARRCPWGQPSLDEGRQSNAEVTRLSIRVPPGPTG